MPSLAGGNGAAKPATSKFQLPALDLKFGSLTEGTDIPPPLPSPIQEEAPELPKAAQPAVNSATHHPTIASNATQTTPEVQSNGLTRSAEQQPPASPTSTKAPPSIRLDGAIPRPPSQSNASIATDKQSKRSSGWFRRLRGSDSLDIRRSSRIFISGDGPKPATPTTPTTPRFTGPPPPKIPEFKALGSKVDISDDAGSLGSDLFKDIK
ncbi:hypothetical protein M406DRAFT_352079 [Cryphonectria parasitica EP155]|uniref:Uncharacterized protein n=1 Tax=Cryphonectria parasitica (strain ATCC 38755 / EP155) TaxID=660469 RepID=A0A9P4Y2U3_CRYP1|nr:uncharacterized protein M406DRAFT_352079 [Cryphonectria parasitica EP155]KAF3765135.1 hypothetical protein M406DRAFT_352079 [Cryphonectria parasitica EP155]